MIEWCPRDKTPEGKVNCSILVLSDNDWEKIENTLNQDSINQKEFLEVMADIGQKSKQRIETLLANERAIEQREKELVERERDIYERMALNKGNTNYYIGENKGVAGEARGSSVGENEGGNTTINNK